MALPIFRPTARVPRRALECFGCIHLQHWLSHLSAGIFLSFFLLKDSKKRGKRIQYLISKHSTKSAFCYTCIPAGRGTQRQFSENICSEDDLRSRIFGTFVVKFLACNLLASPRIFEHLKPGITALFNGFLPWKGHLEFSIAFFLGENFEKVSFDPYDFRITSLSARKSKQMKHF